jgi:hypothetical protein
MSGLIIFPLMEKHILRCLQARPETQNGRFDLKPIKEEIKG